MQMEIIKDNSIILKINFICDNVIKLKISSN